MTAGGPTATSGGPHAGGRVAQAGAPLARARLAVMMAHGRGGSPEDMLELAESLALPDVAYLAPAAAGHSWWPASFLAPIAANEPGLSSGLGVLGGLAERLEESRFGPDRIVVMGFSQGACLALEYAARSGRPFHGIVGLSGGLVGTGEASGPPLDELYGHVPKQFAYDARLAGASVFLGCHERDPHIPLARVQESATVFERLGASVRLEVLPGAGHGVVAEEVRAVRGLLNR
jgi:phospholipase/carboxylesterase